MSQLVSRWSAELLRRFGLYDWSQKHIPFPESDIVMRPLLITLVLLLFTALPVHAVDMPLTGLDCSQHNLTQYRGKWVVVNYWATWCPPCIEEMPDLQMFHDKHSADLAVVIGMNVELISNERLQLFLDDYFITYPIYRASPDEPSPLGLMPGLPTTFLVTPDGEVVARQVGPVTSDMIEQFITNWKPADKL